VSWHPTLSSIERETDRPQDRPRPVTDQARRESALKVIGVFHHCWCGEPHPHDWPGQANGAPHPAGPVPSDPEIPGGR
jgi:hypothetical protein